MKTNRRILLLFMVNFFFLIMPTSGRASVDQVRYVQAVKETVTGLTPELDAVLPGYNRPGEETPTLIVAYLEDETGNTLPWGKTMGQILRWKIMYAPGIRLRMPDFITCDYDAGKPGISKEFVGRSEESIRLLSNRLGITNVLTGKISFQDENFLLKLELKTLPKGEIKKTFHYSGNTEKLPATLSEAVLNIYETLGVNLTQEAKGYISWVTPSTFEELKNYADTSAKLDEKARGKSYERMMGLAQKKISMPLTLYQLLFFMEPGDDLNTYHKTLYDMQKIYPDDTGMELAVVRLIRPAGNQSVLNEKISWLQKIVRNNPHDPTAMIVLADLLASNERSQEAIPVCIESLEQWPDNYRAWWNMGWALFEYAWQIRGHTYWQNVPEEAKDRFPLFLELANMAIDEALRLNPDVPELWVLKMRATGSTEGYSPEVMEYFQNAIRIDPQNTYAYLKALNVTLPKWGGTYEARKLVWDLAKKNITDEAQLKLVRNEYIRNAPNRHKFITCILSPFEMMKDIQSVFALIYLIGFFLFTGGVIFFAYYVIKRRRQS
jgi:tetratricopeptide (TPR) repeat protein